MEYIKKEDILKRFDKNSITHHITFADGVSIFDTIKNFPAVEFPEIVMCKDCKHRILQNMQKTFRVKNDYT